MLSPRAQSWNRSTLLPSEERNQSDLKALELFHNSIFSAHDSLEAGDAGNLSEQARLIQANANPEFFEKVSVSARLFANTLLQQENLVAGAIGNQSKLSLLEVLPTLQSTWFWRIYFNSAECLLIPKRRLPLELSWFHLGKTNSLFLLQKPLIENWLQGFFSPYFSSHFSGKEPIRFSFTNGTWSWVLNS